MNIYFLPDMVFGAGMIKTALVTVRTEFEAIGYLQTKEETSRVYLKEGEKKKA